MSYKKFCCTEAFENGGLYLPEKAFWKTNPGLLIAHAFRTLDSDLCLL
jgi:hypothetical protein